MSKVDVQKIDSDHSPPTSFSTEVKETIAEIRKKAFELFERRGGEPGKELDDWFQAERDLFWVPQADLVETDTEFKIEIDVSGLNARDILVTADPDGILVRGYTEKRSEKQSKGIYTGEFGEKSLYRRFDLVSPIDLDRVTAKVDNETLTIMAPKKVAAKQAKKEEKKDIAVAA